MLQCVLRAKRRRREDSELPQTQPAQAQDEAAWTRNLALRLRFPPCYIDTMYILDLASKYIETRRLFNWNRVGVLNATQLRSVL